MTKKTGTVSVSDLIDEYFTAVAESEGYKPTEIPAFIERQKKLLGEKLQQYWEQVK